MNSFKETTFRANFLEEATVRTDSFEETAVLVDFFQKTTVRTDSTEETVRVDGEVSNSRERNILWSVYREQ